MNNIRNFSIIAHIDHGKSTLADRIIQICGGLSVSDLSESQRRELKLDGAVMVEASDGAAARAGVRVGDLVLQINNVEVRDARQFDSLVAKLDLKKAVALLVRRGETSQYLVIRPRQ